MQYKDKSTAFKVGVLKKCAELRLDEDTEDIVFGLLEKVAETAVDEAKKAVPSPDAWEPPSGAPFPEDSKPAKPAEPAEPAKPAKPDTPKIEKPKTPNAFDRYTSGWADDPWGMAGKAAPWVIGGGLAGGLMGGGKGALLGAGAGLLGPMAQDYIGGLGKGEDTDDGSLINMMNADPTAAARLSQAQKARLKELIAQNPAAFASETAKQNMAALEGYK